MMLCDVIGVNLNSYYVVDPVVNHHQFDHEQLLEWMLCDVIGGFIGWMLCAG